MCFTEFLGYTCGHASVPVKRICPLTTQLYNNPCCDRNAVRPLLAETFCPACARIIHGRWVNIVETEHRFMHERGACTCSVVFPHLQQPRVVTHYVDESDSASSDQPQNQHQHQSGGFEDQQRQQTHENDDTKYRLHHHQNDGAPGSSTSHLSGSAMPFHPSNNQDNGHYGGGGQEVVPWEQMFPNSVASSSNHNPAGMNPTNTDYPGSLKGKGKARENRRRGRKARGRSNSTQTGTDFTTSVQQFRRDVTTTTPSGQSQLAPLFEERQDRTGKKLTVSVRMPSLYGAEWLQDHEVLHKDGRCSCAVRFDRYKGVDMLMHDENQVALNDSLRGLDLSGVNSLADYDKEYLSQLPNASGGTAQGDHSESIAGSSSRKQGQSQNPVAASIPHVTTTPGQPARWACSPEHSNRNDNNTNTQGAVTHPIDMQTAWYNLPDVPLAGLPIGAGPEGDSHMPPFENCELYYPETSQHRRGASH